MPVAAGYLCNTGIFQFAAKGLMSFRKVTTLSVHSPDIAGHYHCPVDVSKGQKRQQPPDHIHKAVASAGRRDYLWPVMYYFDCVFNYAVPQPVGKPGLAVRAIIHTMPDHIFSNYRSECNNPGTG